MIPGSNLLSKAQRLIRPTIIQYYQWTGRVLNDEGEYISEFAAPLNVKANIQPVPRKLYERMGLDYEKRYINIWATTDFQDLLRDRGPDHIVFNNRRYELLNQEDWSPIDDWNSVVGVDIGNPDDF